MKKSIFGTPVVASAILLMVFAAAFATYNTTREGGSSAASIGCAVGNEPVKLFFQDEPAHATRGSRVLLWDATPERTFTLPNDAVITPGKYEVRTISSDTHYTHRSTGPNLDDQPQLEEQYYIEIDGQRTPQKSSDFTDFYDWRGADGELLQDDDNNLDSIPAVVRNTWQGEFIGTIDVTNATSQIKAQHTYAIEAPTNLNQQLVNSVVPSAIILQCVDPGTPVLEVQKLVDGNGDATFNDVLEQTQVGETISWEIIGRNTGDANDPAARIHSCAPDGTSLVANSARVVNGGGTVTENNGCIDWEGPLAEAGSVQIQFDTVLNDFAQCDAIDSVNQQCSCDAVIHSAATGTTEANPADSDAAAVQIAPSELAITKTVDGDNDGSFSNIEQIDIGQTFVWRTETVNNSAFNAPSVVVIDAEPAGVEFQSFEFTKTAVGGATETGNGTIPGGDNQHLWSGDLEPGERVVVEITAVVASTNDFLSCDTNSNGQCTNIATVGTSPSPDDVVDQDGAHVTIPAPTLTINKVVDGVDDDASFAELESVEAGQDFEWRLIVRNTGTVDATAFELVDTITSTAGYSYTAAEVVTSTSGAIANLDTAQIGNGVVSAELTIPAGGSVVIDITANIANETAFDACVNINGVANECVNTVQLWQIDGNGDRVDSDPNQAGDQPYASDTASVILKKDPVLAITKTVDGNNDGTFSETEAIVPGQPFQWKIVATNAADAGVAEGAIITDSLAAGVDFTPAPPASGAIQVTENDATKIGGFFGINEYVWTGDILPGGSVEIVMSTIVTDIDEFLSCDNAPYQGNTAGDATCHNRAFIGTTSNPQTGTTIENAVANDGANVTTNLEASLEIIKQVDGSDDDNQSPGRFSDNDVEEVLPSTAFVWQIVASNTGTADEPNARVRDQLPAGLTLDEDSITYSVDGVDNAGDLQVVTTGSEPVIVWTGALERNQAVTIEFNTTLADFAAYETCVASQGTSGGDVCRNVASVGTTTDSGDLTNFNEVAQDPAYTNVVREPVLVIEKYVDGDVDSDDPTVEFTKREAISANQTTARWQIIGCNVGTADEPLATIYPWRAVDGLADGITYVPGSATVVSGPADGVITEQDGQFVWRGELAVGERTDPNSCVTIEYQTTIDDEAAFETCNIADGIDDDASCTLNAVIGVEDPANNVDFEQADSDDAQIYINPQGELTVLKTVDGDNDDTFSELEEIVPGVDYRYRVVVTNEGTAAIEHAAMYDALPQGVTSIGDAELLPEDFGTVSTVVGDRTLVYWTVESLEPGESVQITFPVRIGTEDAFATCDDDDGNQNGVCTNNAAAGVGETPDDWKGLTENDSAEVVIKPEPNLYIEKTVDGTDADSEFNKEELVTTDDSEFTYKITFGNNGDADAPDSKVATGILPGLTYVSHAISPEGIGEVMYDETSGAIMWNGDLDVGTELELTFVVKTPSDAEYNRCDVADGNEDRRCICTAVLTHGDTELTDNAIVNTEEPVEETVSIEKLVDGNGDGTFSETEEIVIGDDVVWQVSATNTSSVDANGLRLSDDLVAGMKYVAGSLVEVDGAEHGIVSVVDNAVIWEGDLPAGESITFEFTTIFSSLQGFQQCNNDDGNSSDEQCTNPVEIEKIDSGQVLGTDDANVNTPLPSVLAYTGTASVNYIVVVGVVIAAITIATAVIAFITRPRVGGTPGASGPTVTIVPSA